MLAEVETGLLVETKAEVELLTGTKAEVEAGVHKNEGCCVVVIMIVDERGGVAGNLPAGKFLNYHQKFFKRLAIVQLVDHEERRGCYLLDFLS